MWQLINSAPMDGTRCDIWLHRNGGQSGKRITDSRFVLHKGWVLSEGYGEDVMFVRERHGQVTHWMLPPPPPDGEI